MSKKFKGFSLAELLIALLVVSIVLSAAIPTITKRQATSEQIWRWSNKNNNAYFGVGSMQTALLGISNLPEDNEGNLGLTNTFGNAGVDTSNLRFTTAGDKLAILKQSNNDFPNTQLMNSHISFYNLRNGATQGDITYVGRIAMDPHNLAFGIGTLQSMNDITNTFLGRNTALGHYSLANIRGGEYNTAIGEKALTNAKFADDNTAIGFEAANRVDESSTSKNNTDNAIQNTAIGSRALTNGAKARLTTAVGAYSLNQNTATVASTAVGANSLRTATGDGNTALGANSCETLGNGGFNICLGVKSGSIAANEHNNLGIDKTISYGLFIGSAPIADSYSGKINDEPLIFGRLQAVGDLGREVLFNTDTFRVKTYNGSEELFNLKLTANNASAGGSTGEYKFNVFATGTTAANYLKLSGDKTTLKLDSEAQKLEFKLGENLKLIADDTNMNISSSRSIGIGNKDKINLYMAADSTGMISFANPTGVTISANASTAAAATASSNIYLTDGATGGINLAAPSGLINASSQNFSLDSSALKLLKGSLLVGTDWTNGVTISNTDVNIPAITTGAKDVGANLNSLWEYVNNLASGGGGGTASDARLKNILGDNTSGLKEINALEVKNYTYKKDKQKTPHVGVIAQQLQKIFPNSVFEDNEGYLKIRTEEIFYAMVNSIKQLYAQIQDLTAKITGLDKKITELEKQNLELQKQNKEFEKRLSALEKKLSD